VRGRSPFNDTGTANDIPVPGDYNGDGVVERAVWDQATFVWKNPDGGFAQATWGQAGDIPVPGDWVGDGKYHIAVYRPSTFQWWIMPNGPVAWGQAGDIPVPGAYSASGVFDRAVYRPSDNQYYIYPSTVVSLGSGDPPHSFAVPCDYNGDGIMDPAVYNSDTGNWSIYYSPSGGLQPTVLWGGLPGDIPAPETTTGMALATLRFLSSAGSMVDIR
jgi:hypothetical protein